MIIVCLVIYGAFFMALAGSDSVTDNIPDARLSESDSSKGVFSLPVSAFTSEKKFLGMSEAMDYQNSAVQSFAYLRISPENAGNYTVAQACDLWDYVEENWIYVNDPLGPDYISTAPETIKAGLRGDCDDYAVFMSSLIMSVGGECRVISAQNPDGEEYDGHAYPELFIGSSKSGVIEICRYVSARYSCEKVYYSFNTENGNTEYWLNLDWYLTDGKDLYYYLYGDLTGWLNEYHPGRPYYNMDDPVTLYYADGLSKTTTPGYGYYMQKINGVDTLNVL
ncbi:MAG: transglutaminase-like domain-containing protein [Methanomicrobium sp.]|nr:transglutaminase-like domain-containing protein [Methanomicrobium sp.]